MANYLKIKTVDSYERNDPIQSLWRNVLIVALEDAVKQRGLPFYGYARKAAIEYFTIPNRDFAMVCHYAGFDHLTVRRKVHEYLERNKDEREKENMPTVQGERLFQSQEIRQ